MILLCNFTNFAMQLWMFPPCFSRWRGFVVSSLLVFVLLSGQFLYAETIVLTVSGVRNSPTTGSTGGSQYSRYTQPSATNYTYTLQSVSASVTNSDYYSISGSADAEYNNGYYNSNISKPGNASLTYQPVTFTVVAGDWNVNIDFSLSMYVSFNGTSPSSFQYDFTATWLVVDNNAGGDDTGGDDTGGDDTGGDDTGGDDTGGDDTGGDDTGGDDTGGDDTGGDDTGGDDTGGDDFPGGTDDETLNGLRRIYNVLKPTHTSVPFGTVVDGLQATYDQTWYINNDKLPQLMTTVDWTYERLNHLDDYLTTDNFTGDTDLTPADANSVFNISYSDISNYGSNVSNMIGANPYTKLGYSNLVSSYADNDGFVSEKILSIPQELGGLPGISEFGLPDPVLGNGVPWSTYGYYFAPLSRALIRFVMYTAFFVYVLRKFGWD